MKHLYLFIALLMSLNLYSQSDNARQTLSPEKRIEIIKAFLEHTKEVEGIARFPKQRETLKYEDKTYSVGRMCNAWRGAKKGSRSITEYETTELDKLGFDWGRDQIPIKKKIEVIKAFLEHTKEVEGTARFPKQKETFEYENKKYEVGTFCGHWRTARKGKKKTQKIANYVIAELDKLDFDWGGVGKVSPEKKIEIIKAFLEHTEKEEGKARFPKQSETFIYVDKEGVKKEYNVGNFCSTWRSAKKGKSGFSITEFEITELDKLGFDWGKSKEELAANPEKRIEVIKAFLEYTEKTEGTARFPKQKETFTYVDNDGVEKKYSVGAMCGMWRGGKKGHSGHTITEYEITELDKLGFDWGQDHIPPKKKIEIIKAFLEHTRQEEDEARFPKTDETFEYNGKEYNVGRFRDQWRAAKKGKHKTYTISKYEIAELDKLYFDWGIDKLSPEKKIEVIKAFLKYTKEEEGKARFPAQLEKFIYIDKKGIEKDYNIGSICTNWRSARRNKKGFKITKYEITELDKLGFDWDPKTKKMTDHNLLPNTIKQKALYIPKDTTVCNEDNATIQRFIPESETMTNDQLKQKIAICGPDNFIIPTEDNPAPANVIFKQVGEGLYIAVGTVRGLIAASMSNATYLLLIDRDPAIIGYNRVNIGLISISTDMEDLRYLILKAPLTEWTERADKYTGPLAKEVKEALKSEYWYSFFIGYARADEGRMNTFLTTYKEGSAFYGANYHFEKIQYDKLKSMTDKGSVSTELVNLIDAKLMAKIAESAKAKWINIAALDISNAWQQASENDQNLFMLESGGNDYGDATYDAQNFINMINALKGSTDSNSLLILTIPYQSAYIAFHMDYIIKHLDVISELPNVINLNHMYKFIDEQSDKTRLNINWNVSVLLDPDVFSWKLTTDQQLEQLQKKVARVFSEKDLLRAEALTDKFLSNNPENTLNASQLKQLSIIYKELDLQTLRTSSTDNNDLVNRLQRFLKIGNTESKDTDKMVDMTLDALLEGNIILGAKDIVIFSEIYTYIRSNGYAGKYAQSEFVDALGKFSTFTDIMETGKIAKTQWAKVNEAVQEAKEFKAVIKE